MGSKTSSNIQVIVRVRPVNEQEENNGFCMEGNDLDIYMRKVPILKSKLPPSPVLSLVNSKCDTNIGDESMYQFSFDKVFWCHSHQNLKDFSGTDSIPKIIDAQNVVYDFIGPRLLESSLEGYHCCLLAYGQTGSGKSFSMMGNKVAPGIIPKIVSGLFDGLRKKYELRKPADDLTNAFEDITVEEDISPFSIQLGYYEIYNEKVKDLLVPVTCSPVKYRVREHPIHGPYVENLSKWNVDTEEQLLDLITQGNENRSVASTRMNDTSSRSHAVLTLTIIQTQTDSEGNQLNSKISKMNLVDLAGSERVSVSGTSGQTLKEGGQINKSLTTLGLVIKALSSISDESRDEVVNKNYPSSPISPKRKKKNFPFVPFRDSLLTWLLKDALGGNSKTILLATLSPSSAHFTESLSTLRYASQAKNIVNKAKINEAPHVKLIRELQDEVDRLRETVRILQNENSRNNFQDNENSVDNFQYEKRALEANLTIDTSYSMTKPKAIAVFEDKVVAVGRTSLSDIQNWSDSLQLPIPMAVLSEQPVTNTNTRPRFIRVPTDNANTSPLIYQMPIGVSWLTDDGLVPENSFKQNGTIFIKVFYDGESTTMRIINEICDIKIDGNLLSSQSGIFRLFHGMLIEINAFQRYRFICDLTRPHFDGYLRPKSSSSPPFAKFFGDLVSANHFTPIKYRYQSTQIYVGDQFFFDDSGFDSDSINVNSIRSVNMDLSDPQKKEWNTFPDAFCSASPQIPLFAKVQITIPQFYTRNDFFNPSRYFIVYLINVQYEGTQWTLERRYSQFKSLLLDHYTGLIPDALRKTFPSKWIGARALLSKTMTLVGPSLAKNQIILRKSIENGPCEEEKKSNSWWSLFKGKFTNRTSTGEPVGFNEPTLNAHLDPEDSLSSIASNFSSSSFTTSFMEDPGLLNSKTYYEALEKRREGLQRFIRGLIIWLSQQPFSILHYPLYSTSDAELQSIHATHGAGLTLDKKLDIFWKEMPILSPLVNL